MSGEVVNFRCTQAKAVCLQFSGLRAGAQGPPDQHLSPARSPCSLRLSTFWPIFACPFKPIELTGKVKPRDIKHIFKVVRPLSNQVWPRGLRPCQSPRWGRVGQINAVAAHTATRSTLRPAGAAIGSQRMLQDAITAAPKAAALDTVNPCRGCGPG